MRFRDRVAAAAVRQDPCGGRNGAAGRALRTGTQRRCVVVLAVLLAPGCGGGERAPAGVLAAAREAVNQAAGTFDEETRVVLLVDSLIEEASRDAEAAAELGLLRLRAIERVIADSAARNSSPFSTGTGRPGGQPVRAWLDDHRAAIVYSEPAGQWLVPADVFWELHDRHRRTLFSDEIAWAAANAGLPGECEGFAACYVDGLLRTHVRYIESHPDGAYVADALRQVTALLEEIGDADPGRPICGAAPDAAGLRAEQLERIRRTLDRLPASAGGPSDAARRALAALERRCATGP